MIKKVYSFNSELHIVSGVQKVLLDVHNALKDNYEAKIVGLLSFEKINPELGIKHEEYVLWRNPFLFHNSIVILHERKFLFLFYLLNLLLFQNIKIVYIHHNLLYGHRFLTHLPKTTVYISESGKNNLIQEFGAKENRLHKIYNCTKDEYTTPHKPLNKRQISILYPARIDSVKRQIELVKHLRGKIDKNVKILFAGDGPLLEELRKEIGEDSQFESIGFVSDIKQLMADCDFVMLFSDHEGLPISLIEATMMGVPIICNDVGGNTEIGHVGENAFVADDWDALIETLNSLPELPVKEYERMCRASRAIYEKHFTYSIFKKNYLDLVRSI